MLPGIDWQYLIPAGKVGTLKSDAKYGRCLDCDNGVETDIWDKATGAAPLWVAPTAARIHAIVSSDGDDASGGLGANTIRIYGLTDWDSLETFEDISMAGASPINTVNSYVIIHRMLVLTCGASGPNVGTISATAAAPDSTVTAQIAIDKGQTLMAIYGVPSVQRAYIPHVYGSINRAIATAANFTFYRATDVESTTLAFTTALTLGGHNTGDSSPSIKRIPWPFYQGPTILKLAVETSTNDSDCSGGFDVVLERPVGT